MRAINLYDAFFRSPRKSGPGWRNRGETQACGPTDPQGGRRAIPDRAVVEMHLGTVRPECDRPESPDDDAEVRIGRGLKYPKDKGYAKFLTTLGYDRNWAGMLAAKIAEKGDQA